MYTENKKMKHSFKQTSIINYVLNSFWFQSYEGEPIEIWDYMLESARHDEDIDSVFMTHDIQFYPDKQSYETLNINQLIKCIKVDIDSFTFFFDRLSKDLKERES